MSVNHSLSSVNKLNGWETVHQGKTA